MRYLLVFLTFALLACFSQARSIMEPPYSIRDRAIEAPENVHHAFRKQFIPAARLLLDRHDEIVLALKRMLEAADAPEWIKADGLYTVTCNDKTSVFRIEFASGISPERIEEFSSLFGTVYSRVCRDVEVAALEAFQKELEDVRKQTEEEKDLLRRALLAALLTEKVRILRNLE
jgi:hypothetical protein